MVKHIGLRAGCTLQKGIEERFTGHHHDTSVSETPLPQTVADGDS